MAMAHSRLFPIRSLLNQSQILVHRWPGQLAQPRKLRNAEISVPERRIVLVEHGGDIILRRRFAAYVLALRLSVLHAASDSRPNDR